MRHEIHGGLSFHEIPFFVKAPDLFIHPRTVGWLSGSKREAMKKRGLSNLENLFWRTACVFRTWGSYGCVRASSEEDLGVGSRSEPGWRGEMLIILASVVVVREGCRKRGVYAGSITPDLVLV